MKTNEIRGLHSSIGQIDDFWKYVPDIKETARKLECIGVSRWFVYNGPAPLSIKRRLHKRKKQARARTGRR
jgi:hypothetical protein